MIVLAPNYVVVNSISTTDILCTNHQPDDLPLMISLSKNISIKQLKISRYQLNKTTIRIRLRFKNYLGMFHLFCYVKNKKNHGARADVVVISI